MSPALRALGATACAVAAAIFTFLVWPAPDRSRDGPPGAATVVRAVDGDTLVVTLATGGTETVRLIGVDTPETVAPRRPVECFGPEAAAALAALVPPGTEVRLSRDVEPRDRYDRLLAYVHRRRRRVRQRRPGGRRRRRRPPLPAQRRPPPRPRGRRDPGPRRPPRPVGRVRRAPRPCARSRGAHRPRR